MEKPFQSALSAIILAGGKSSRMGKDKALIEIKGVPLLQRSATLIQAYANPIYIITPWIERYQRIVPSSCYLLQEVCPSGDSQGPLVGFAQALSHVKTEWVLLLACDLPNLTTQAIEEWLQQLHQVSDQVTACLPLHEKGWDPLCGFYRSSCLTSLESFIQAGGRSFQQWLQCEYVQELFVSDRSVLFNCNTQMDLKGIIEKSR
ncbi:putative molybdopterin-guanine dinucleotide biosynthesis protein A [Crocosphaera subtropica ATCC 51142]|uniref:Probable molybdenum cofactor guanylyltransferase n=1 Tax=Crocosphaera subtropica (strain ATCC 51142 / BH68) TaxID=43989 RepID=B1WZ83_CROS5|nr:molybdenum cofactor guanylyltransferase [Crocosphaera subtropica]ACB49449.1 putative molybdopterin-guanine dinucleotide biosynthesis protein A [Crocosphaera subtropica ATCC 51142]